MNNERLYFFYPKSLDEQYKRLTGLSLSQSNLPELQGVILLPLGKMPKWCKHSSRRLKVQAKRKRLGLPVDGKIAFTNFSGIHYNPSRRECYRAAIQADKELHGYERYRLQVIIMIIEGK